jgi:hypothetical protein
LSASPVQNSHKTKNREQLEESNHEIEDLDDNQEAFRNLQPPVKEFEEITGLKY